MGGFIILYIVGILPVANILARIISATFNYTMNKKIVFKSNVSVKKSATMYAALAIFILALNTGLLAMITHIGISAYIAKIMTEFVMFFVSYSIQHSIIFRKKDNRESIRNKKGEMA